MLPDKDLSRGNGLLEMSTFMAIILGTSVGSAIFAIWKHSLPLIGLLMLALAVLGALASLGIARVPPSGAAKLFRLNPFGEIASGLQRLRADRPLWLTVIGISYFWFLGALVQINMLFFGKELLGLDEFHIGLLGTFLAIGIGAGQMSRVDSVFLAIHKARQQGHDPAGSVLASDAFFPFADGVEQATAAGVAAIIQPGGSVRDAEVIEAADRRDVAMVMTGKRQFRH